MTSLSTAPQAGDKAPLFTLPNQDGVEINLHEVKSKYVVIYFYPKALTPGCTTQACDLRDHWKELQVLDAVVFGISPDAPKLLRKFKDTHNLPFDLLSDAEHRMATAFDVWKEKSMYGKTYMGMMRDSYILDAFGTVIGVLHKVNPNQHVSQLMDIISKHESQIS